MLLISIFSLCAESTIDVQSMQKQMLDQMLCMSQLSNGNYIERLQKNNLIQNEDLHRPKLACEPCRWRGVVCEGGHVTKIKWNRNFDFIGEMNIEWLPRHVRAAIIKDQRVQPLDTRRLPRGLQILHIVDCGLPSKFAFNTLPEKLEDLNLNRNRIEGTMHIFDLPKGMRRIDIRWSKIDCLVVHNASLPVCLEIIKVHAKTVTSQHTVQKVKMVEMEGGKLDKRVIRY